MLCQEIALKQNVFVKHKMRRQGFEECESKCKLLETIMQKTHVKRLGGGEEMKSKAEQQSGRAKHKSRDEEQSMNSMKLVIPLHCIS